MSFFTVHELGAFSSGRSEGWAEGRAEGIAESILKILRMRFGQLPDTLVDRIYATKDEEPRDAALIASVTAKSLADFERALGQ